MEPLYSKLYEKYTKLKTKKESALDELNRDQEVKFMKCVSAADNLIAHLRTESDELRAQVSDLRHEVASIRSAKDEQHIEYQKLLMEENCKYKELSDKVERLQRKEFHSSGRDDKFENGQVNMPGDSPVLSDGTSNSTLRKRRRDFRHEKDSMVTMPASDQLEHARVGETGNELSKENMSSGTTSNIPQPKCCRRTAAGSINITDSTSCMFQELVECLVDLKFSIVTQTDEILITAVHESGYSFSLRWVKNSAGEEELMYSVSSLGTFERIAPEWMREVMIFSKRMCPIFFKRVSRVINLHD